MTIGRRAGVPTLILDVKPCGRRQDDSTTLPIYRAKMYRRFQCVVPVLYRWLRDGTPQTNTISNSSKLRLVETRVSQLPERPSNRQEYMNCVGPDVVGSDELDGSSASGLASTLLSGRHMTVATINRPPFIVLETSGKEIVGATGFCIEMLREIAKRFNFTYTLVLPYDGNWGSPMKNGTFNGMVGMVQRQTVDFAIAGFTITYIRDTVIDFTHAFYEEPTTILIPPPSEETNFLAFLKPFSWKVWAVTLASILVVGPLLWVLANVGHLPVLYPHDRRNVSYPLLRYVWDCAFSLTSQSSHMRQTEPVRVLYGMWWTLCVILIYTYTGTLIAFLTVPRLASLINSLEELADQKEVLWTYRARTAHDVLFSNAPPPSTYNKIGRLLKERPELLVETDKEGVEAVLKGHTAFIKEKSWLDFAMEEDYLRTKECRLAQVNQQFFSAGFGWVLQEDSPYLQLFNTEILKMAQSGLFTIWKQQYWPSPNECSVSGAGTASGPKPLQLKNFLGHFFLFAVGLGLALLAFLMEAAHRMCQRVNEGDNGVEILSKFQDFKKGKSKKTTSTAGIHLPDDRVCYLRVIALGKSIPCLTQQQLPAHPADRDTPVIRMTPSIHHPQSQGRYPVQARPPIRSYSDRGNITRGRSLTGILQAWDASSPSPQPKRRRSQVRNSPT
ncbi:glutamate receptor U1-like [Panulirus ornatus]|uniref:glutamate receptor U1-like n=1 Tax=Panulirus ornatus TaxID=150431 RepID=UPI003A88BD50